MPKPPPLILRSPALVTEIGEDTPPSERGSRAELSEDAMDATTAVLTLHPEVCCGLFALYTPQPPGDPAEDLFDFVHTAMCVQDEQGITAGELMDFLDKLIPALLTLRRSVEKNPEDFDLVRQGKPDA